MPRDLDVEEEQRDFEEFCLKLIRRRHPGDEARFHRRGDASHADGGVDVEGESQGRRVGVQCKSGAFGKDAMIKACDALLRYPHRLDEFVLISAKHPSPEARDAFEARRRTLATAEGPVGSAELWGPDELRELFGDRPQWSSAWREARRLLESHSRAIRRQFEFEPVWGREGLTLRALYVDLDCGLLEWGVVAKSLQSEDHPPIDPFQEDEAPRTGLLETTLDRLFRPGSTDFVVIQGTAGAGKSTFTYRLAVELLATGHQPIRIRLRDVDLDGDPLTQFLNHLSIVETSRRVARINPEDLLDNPGMTVIILDGWDEVTLGAAEGLRAKVSAFLVKLRREIDPRYRPNVRVVLTGRPTEAVTNSRNLTDSTPVLTIRRLTPAQLSEYFARLDDAYASFGRPFDRDRVIEDYRREWDLGPPPPGFGPRGSLDVVGWPLLAHVAYRLLRECEPERHGDILHDRTTLLRCLTEYCFKHSRRSSDAPEGGDILTRHDPADLRVLVQETAIAATHTGEEYLSRATLEQEMKGRGKPKEVERRLKLAENFEIFVVNFLFKTRYDQLGCEFVHKSLREFAFAEAVVDRIKRLGRPSPDPIAEGEALALLLSRAWLSREVRQLLESQLAWETNRDVEARDDPKPFRREEPPAGLDAWAEARDRLVGLWSDWNLLMSAGLPADGRSPLSRVSAHSIDAARLGDALFRLTAALHSALATRLLSGLGLLDPRASFWSEHGVVGLETSAHQTTLFAAKEPRLKFFSPNMRREGNETPLRAALARVNGARPGLTEELADRTDLAFLVLVGAPLHRTAFRFCLLTHANLSESDLTGSDFEGSDLSNADLTKADLTRANFESAELGYACLARTRLEGASFKSAELTGTDFRGARGLTRAQILQAADWRNALFDPELREALEREPD